MHTPHELIELAKQRLALKNNLPLPMTDYRLAKLMNIRQATISGWRTGVRGIGTEFAAQFAAVCELPEAYVFACIEHEREKNPSVLRILEAIAKTFSAGRAAALAIVATLLIVGMPEKQAFSATVAKQEYTLCAKRRRRNCSPRRRSVPRKPLLLRKPTRKHAMRTALIATAALALAACTVPTRTPEENAQRAQIAMARENQRQFGKCMQLTLGRFASFQAPEVRLRAAEACKQPSTP
jgi:hypothetical protein